KTIREYQQTIDELNFLIKKIKMEYQQSIDNLLSKNQILQEQWDTRFDNQSKCVAAVIEIAQKEHENVYNDIVTLINDKERFNLKVSAIKYSLAKSKTIIDIDNHIISAESFTKFIKWQEHLAGKSEPFPKGLVFMAFDNKQKGQKLFGS